MTGTRSLSATTAAAADNSFWPVAPLWFVGAIALTGTAAAAWAVESPGPGVFLLLVALMAGGCLVLTRSIEMNLATVWPAAAALVLIAGSVFRAAEWVVVVDLLAALVLAAVSVGGGRSWVQLADAVLTPAMRFPLVPGFVLRALAAPLRHTGISRATPFLRGLVVGGALVLLFGVLFASADAVFQSVVADLLFPDWDLGLIPSRVFVFGFVAIVTTAFALATIKGRINAVSTSTTAVRKKDWRIGRAEWLTSLGLLNLLFFGFVALQAATGLAGHDYIRRTTDITYAEYAREGVAQLIVAAALTLAVVAGAWELARRKRQADELLLKGALGGLCLFTVAILASAFRRLVLYEEAFGFTRARITAHALIIWLGIIFAVLIVAGAVKKRGWLPRAMLAVSAAGLVLFNAANPDGLIARHNAERFRTTGKIDIAYLSSLSADAAPALSKLPEAFRACVLAALSDRLPDSEPWSSANLARIRARRLLEDHPLPLSNNACVGARNRYMVSD